MSVTGLQHATLPWPHVQTQLEDTHAPALLVTKETVLHVQVRKSIRIITADLVFRYKSLFTFYQPIKMRTDL